MKRLALVGTALLCTPASAQWSTEFLSVGRTQLGAETVGSVAVFAGGRTVSGGVANVDMYDASTGTWSTTTLANAQSDIASAAAGGVALFKGPYYPVVDVFDGTTWSTTVAPSHFENSAAASAGDLILFGGGGEGSYVTDRAEVYDTTTGTWSTKFLSDARHSLAATGVGNLALFAGGSVTPTSAYRSTVDIFDATTSTWSTSSLSVARSELAATSVGTQALFAGGITPHFSSRVDIYDAATGTWSNAFLSEARHQLTATSVGRYALFAGGVTWGNNLSDRVDIYDSLTGTWSTATLSFARRRLNSTTVGELAMFAGGDGPGYVFFDVVDVFDAGLGTMYCVPAAPNSTGLPGILSAVGSLSVAMNETTLIARQLPPGQFGYFLASLNQGFVQPPAGQGPICLSGNIGRYNRATEVIQGPSGSLQLDLTSMPVNPQAAAMPGDTWNFQCWYRDVNPGSTSNTTNGLSVTFTTTGAPAVQFAVTQAGVVEDTTLLEARVTLSQATNQDVQVSWTTGGTATVNVDWRVEEASPFVIPAGETSADMTLLVAEDSAPESTETATVTLTGASGAVLGTASTFTLTILDDD